MAKLLHLVSNGDNYVVNPSNIDTISGNTDAQIFSGNSVATIAGVTAVDVVGKINKAIRDLNNDTHVIFLTIDLGGTGITVSEVGAA